MSKKASSNFWQGKRVVVTGGAGFIGSHLTKRLVKKGAWVTVMGRRPLTQINSLASLSPKAFTYVTLDLGRPTPRLFSLLKGQDIVFHLAGRIAGIEFNRNHPATMLRDNLRQTLNILEIARKAKIDRFQFVSSACVYPRFCTIPTPESEGFLDEPEPTNYGYGWAKRIGEVLAKTYAQEYGMKISIVRPYNCYGPFDNFAPETSHVIPALIKRVIGGENPVIVWGDGTPTRSFLYVEDLARGLMAAVEKYPEPDPINLGTEEEISIKDLIKLIIKISGRKSRIVFDKTKPNGQPRRNCDTRKAREKIGFKAKINLSEGLKRTLVWYQQDQL